MWKKVILFLFYLSLVDVLPAQDAQVYYNLFNDSVYYMQNGRAVKRLKIRKGDRVLLHYTEFNPYLYDATLKVEQSNSSEWGSGGSGLGALTSLVPGLAGLMPGLSSMAASAAPVDTTPRLHLMDMQLLKLGETSIRLKDLFSNSRGTTQQLTQARSMLEELVESQQEMAQIYASIQAIEKREQVAQLAVVNLDKLPYNPRLKPTIIQQQSREYFQAVFQKEPGNDSGNLQDIWAWEELPAEKQGLLQQLGVRQREFSSKSQELAPLAAELLQTDVGSVAFSNFARDLYAVQGQTQRLDQQINEYVRQQMNGGPMLSVQQIIDLQVHFLELLNNPFAYEYAVQVDKETVLIEATFTPRDTALLRKNRISTAQKTKTLVLKANGGIKISASIGANFGSFFNAAQEFSIREDRIVVEQLGAFQPSITSFVHFHPNTHGEVSVAGSFGIGFPIGNLDAQSINFCLGPSLIFGRGQRIVFSTGLMGGQVARLAKGYQPGDAFNLNNGDIPTRRRYELGYFAGVSFNVGGR